MNIKFKKFGLSPDDIQQMKNYGILPDKRTLQSLSRAYNSINPSIEDIIEFQDKLGFKVDLKLQYEIKQYPNLQFY